MIHIVAKSEFAKAKREPLLDYAKYSDEAEDISRRVPNAQKKLNDPDWLSGKDEAALVRLTEGRCDYAIDLLTLSYSAGAHITELQGFFPHVVEYFEEFALYIQAFNRTYEGMRLNSPVIHLQDVEFQIANRLLCFSVLLGHTKLIPRIMEILDYNNPVRDGLLERIASCYTQRPSPLPDECMRHLPYYKALPIFDAQLSDRPGLTKAYLLDWYEASRREPYYDAHTGAPSFMGYWAWEAAAITIALNVDDQSYRDLPFYPRDLVEHRRNATAASVTQASPTETAEIRAKAGETCPIGGRWQSIGVPVHDAVYTEGATMQDLKSPYGLTVWRFLGAA
ncbi:PoNi-like cognate immunity protein [Telluria mixta]|uniref:PoNi-like cognate immunity protein n=1 Tax=Telluria mixta TaxID=34071 RepID=A0ABT2C0T2_9BURK|nr:PoNi-like cognate immunity protein [Telluria mixta]MCS0630466.1 PoNi-like cognate immunity protein [Telluria mixta]WEM94231.1 PoNi-like cognate immunity protein [Telluria mixta]